MLSTRFVTGHDAIKKVNRFASDGVDNDLIYKIIDKDLDIRIGAKGINKGVPGLIPTFSVALAKEYEEGKCDWNDGWFVSRKLDGVRCIARVDGNGNCKLFSRTGKEFKTLDKVKESIESTGIINVTFDGEICLVDKDGNEDFQGVMKQLRKKDHQIQNPSYMIFDMMNNKHFDDESPSSHLEFRLYDLRSWIDGKFQTKKPTNIIKYAEQYRVIDDEHLAKFVKLSTDNNWEGVMLRKNVAYEGKRTKNLVKVKKFFDAEYKVVDFDIDNHEVVRDGKSVTMQMLAQVYIEHKGHRVKVGSGFTQEQRLQYMDGSIVGKTITVQYFEETHNDKGGISLRFPTVKHIYDTPRDM
jgi:DNA ligase-1